jgi:hypothetical protein
MLSEEDKNEIMHIIDKTAALISKNTYIGLTKDRKKEKEFIDESVRYWKEEFSTKVAKIIGKLNTGWKDKIRNFNKPKKKEDLDMFN